MALNQETCQHEFLGSGHAERRLRRKRRRLLVAQPKYKVSKGLQLGGLLFPPSAWFFGIGFKKPAGTGVVLLGVAYLGGVGCLLGGEVNRSSTALRLIFLTSCARCRSTLNASERY